VTYHTADRQRCLQFECAMQTSLFSFAQIVSRHFHHKPDSGVCAVILVITTTSHSPLTLSNILAMPILHICLTNNIHQTEHRNKSGIYLTYSAILTVTTSKRIINVTQLIQLYNHFTAITHIKLS